jgi:minor extracellular protease Epr
MVMTDEAKGIGVEVMTDRYGRATFQLSDKVRVLDAVYVDPLHSGWPVALTWVPLAPGGMQVGVPCIDLSAADVRGLVYGKPRAGDGRGVRVGVVDTGVGPHPALKVEGGRNTTTEAVQRFRDEDGHRSHVAGGRLTTRHGIRRRSRCRRSALKRAGRPARFSSGR